MPENPYTSDKRVALSEEANVYLDCEGARINGVTAGNGLTRQTLEEDYGFAQLLRPVRDEILLYRAEFEN